MRYLAELASFSGLTWLLSLAVVLLAGAVRGFAGFGFSALSVSALSLFLPPAQVIPPLLMLEIAASITLLRSAWKDTDWTWLSWLMLGNVLCIPVGLALLSYAPENTVRLLIGLVLVVVVSLQLRGLRWTGAPTRRLRLLTGLVSGLVNGVAAMGGLGVVVMLNASSLSPLVLRATLVLLFLFGDIYALLCAGLMPTSAHLGAPLLGWETLRLALALLPAMLLGMALGQRLFHGVSPQRFRRYVLQLLLLLALITLTRAAWQLLHAALPPLA